MKKNVYLFEINDVIANQMKLPYSTGLIWSYCLEAQAVKDNYQLAEWFYYRDDDKSLDTMFDNVDNPSVVGFNCFVWNKEMVGRQPLKLYLKMVMWKPVLSRGLKKTRTIRLGQATRPVFVQLLPTTRP